jgi:hypothetical protein
MALTYHDDQPAQAPPWLLGPYGMAWLSAFGDQKDWIADIVRQAVKARFPNLAPSDALQLIAEERSLLRGLTEPEVNFRSRLLTAWDLWTLAGTPLGILRAFLYAGFPSVIIQTQVAKQFTLDGSSNLITANMGTPVHLGGSPELNSDMGVLITQPWPSWWGGSAPADGSQDQKTAALLIKQWKPAHSRCVSLKAVNGPAWDVDGFFWDTSGKLWDQGTSVTWTPPVG